MTKIKVNIVELVKTLTNDYKEILHTDTIKDNKQLHWGGNGVGDRWANKKFNYGVIYGNGKTKIYSENDNDIIPEELLNDFMNNYKGNGIIGIFVFSERMNIQTRPINKHIHKQIVCNPCVSCGSRSEIVCDHKNDLYNDPRVLNEKTQTLDDFQPLCNHCNLVKRQVCKDEIKNGKLYSAQENIPQYKIIVEFEFTWEKKPFDITNIDCKRDTYWYDPIAFAKRVKNEYEKYLMNKFENTLKLIA